MRRAAIETVIQTQVALPAGTGGYLLDWDGCCAIANVVVPSAVRFMQAWPSRVAIVSNNSSNTIEDFRDILAEAGLFLRPEQIILAGVETLRRAAEASPEQVLVLGEPRMRAEARRLGVRLNASEPDIVVLLRDTRFSYRRLEITVNAIARGARLLVANPDTTHPGKDHRLKPETGAWLSAIRACVAVSDDRIDIIGKPRPLLFEKGCDALGVAPACVVMIGDNPSTDILGATELGMQTLLVNSDPESFFATLNQALKIA